MVKAAEITTAICQQKLSELLRLFVGRARKFSRDEFVLVTGFDRGTVDKYLTGETMPCVAKLLRMMAVIDEPHFVNGMLDIAGFSSACRNGEVDDCVRDGLSAAGRMSRAVAMIAEHRSDGALTAQEELSEAKEAAQLGSQLIDFSERVSRKHGIK